MQDHGIHKEFITQYTPQQNGITERKNRTIMEMARSMLASKHLPNEYWGEVVATIIYIMDQCLTKSVKNKVRQEAWTGMNHSVSHLKFFSCVTYSFVLDEIERN